MASRPETEGGGSSGTGRETALGDLSAPRPGEPRAVSTSDPSPNEVLSKPAGLSGWFAELAELEKRSKHEYVSPSARALIYMGLGDKDQTFAWLDKAYAERDWRLRELKSYPLYDSLRSDPRFTQLLKQLHLE